MRACWRSHRGTLSPPRINARSIQPDALISFEDGKAYKTLRRNLTRLGLTPEAYRAKWGLPDDCLGLLGSALAARARVWLVQAARCCV